jgi:uncharacterized protein DUF1236
MKKQIWIGVAAGTALLGSTALTSAQQMPEKGPQPSAREKAPEGKGMREPSGAQQQPGTGTERPNATGQPGRDRPMGAERPGTDRPKTTEQPGKDRPKGAEAPDKDRSKTTDRPDKDRPKGAEAPDKDRSKTTDRPDKDRPKGAERLDKDGAGRTQLSEQQRTDVGSKLRETRIEKTRLQVDVNVGSRIPRSVRLHALPGAILATVPAYRGHSYFVRDDDTIVIVDERTYVVVDVIPATTRMAGLSLSRDQMHFIYTRVPKDRVADVRVRLALGAEVPADVQLAFPGEIVARVPEMDRYRFVVAGDDVAVVDPRDNAVVLVINE